MFPEIPDFFLKISKFFSKYLEKVLNISKNIWLHVINITVKTQQYSLSSKMATHRVRTGPGNTGFYQALFSFRLACWNVI